MEDMELRTMRITRIFKAPVALLWEVWTNPEHIVNWWGPNGFTNTIQTMDVSEGGEWRLTMHGPDGTDYANRSVFLELVPMQKIVYEHFNPHFITTVLFEARGNETYMDWSMLFDTAEMRDIVVKAHKAEEGLKQNVEKLEEYLRAKQI
ncbi:SRPBCC family protein [Mucilaginibacter pedocola]|uniref:Polyketide cyclase n=1 Tax=Mucilaginibacter pedocola TaxID=1792845 RepID=A0A1S9PLE0_9SPHI|nr:SRPBCC family protein [Mucilaginibacter pedocola]OOQ61749.1 polyketide cyclase [Mucilaginibacter pedocola]